MNQTTMISNWTWTEPDQRVADDLQQDLPERLFDAHAHLYRKDDLTGVGPEEIFAQTPGEASFAQWHDHLGRQVGSDRLVGGLFFPVPRVPTDGIDAANNYLEGQLRPNQASRGLMLVDPGYPEAKVADRLAGGRIVGFKVYHTFSPMKPTIEAPIDSFLPEWVWQCADEHRLVIMLHLVKSRALTDPDNRRYLRASCEKYPNARLILAHAARSCHAPHAAQGLPALRGLENVWFDTSGICESAALTAILEQFGPRRLLWGSDFPISEIRGKCVTVGEGFGWLQPDTVHWDRLAPLCDPTLVGLESLRALQQAIDDVGLNRDDVRDVYCDNTLRLLGMHDETTNQTQSLYQRAKQLIPAGTQLLSKRPEMYAPDQWPAYFREARGCEVWDLDGRHYYDVASSGIGSCLLGYRHPDVTRAVKRRMMLGGMSTLNPPEEVAFAEVLCDIHPWAEQARFARTGGEAVAVAVRIARATTGRSTAAVCGYHGWHDWYLAANLGDSDRLRGHLLPGLDPTGVPSELRGTTLPFRYDSREQFQAILDKHGDQLAAVVMEPSRYHAPEPGSLEFVRDRAHQHGALLIFDEISIGWRLCFGGAHLKFGVDPDMAVFAKALGNGHPMAAVIGTRDAMAGAHESFVSSTYWTESVGPAAALAVIDVMRQINVPDHVAHVGTAVRDLWRRHGKRHELPVVVGDGWPCLDRFHFEHELAGELRTLYTQEMLRRGILAAGSIYPTLAHTDEIIARFGEAIDDVFAELHKDLEMGTVKERLNGPVAHSHFRRLT